jgi:DNA-3-methyladenine glycosylase
MKKLPHTFFEQKTLVVARELIGKVLVRKVGNKIIRDIITETEAYVGSHDLASHSSKGRTPRTEVMYAQGGTIYVYLIYGMYYMLNIITEKENFPAGVLIRGTMKVTGPGKVAREFSIDMSLKGKPLGEETGLWIEEGLHLTSKDIIKTPRIGIDYAGVWKDKPYRFVLKKKL